MTITQNRLRIAQVTLGLEIGGQERLLVEMARHRDQAYFDWTVIVLGKRGKLADAIEATGVRLVPLGDAGGFRPGLWRQLARLFRQERFDVVHTHDDRPLLYGMPAAWWAGVSTRIHTNHHGRLAHVPWRHRFLMRQASRFTQTFVCVSHDSARYVIEQGVLPTRVQTLWNGIDLTRFAYHGPCHDGSIVTVARLSAEKDVGALLRAARSVIDAFPKLRFEIAGDGPCRSDLAQLAKQLQLTDHVVFHGEVSDVPSLLARARLFVLPSQSEGISLTLLEAMACGLPVVATQVGGNPEVVEANVTGLLVPAHDPESLAQAIGAIVADPARGRAMGVTGRQRVENNFDIRKMMTQYESLYVSCPRSPKASG
jgi:glycosyltransferase involved in cell wall biosynthesis